MPTQFAPLLKSPTPHSAATHLHLADEVCPLCEQPIPHDRFDEIKERIEARDQERSAEIADRLRDQFAREKAQLLEKAQQDAAAALEQERHSTAEKVTTARDEARQA